MAGDLAKITIAASMQCVVNVLRELKELGVWHAIDGSECWDSDTIAAAVEYQRTTGRNPVKERHMIMSAEDHREVYDSYQAMVATESDRKVAEDVLNGGFWKVSEEARETIQWALREADRRKSYAFRREEANLHIANRSVRKRIFKRDGQRCLHCGKTKSLSVDHVVAVVNGGGNDDENLQTLCRSCNSSKGAKAFDGTEPLA